jgi:uncharacterized protein (TIGR01777 family)
MAQEEHQRSTPRGSPESGAGERYVDHRFDRPQRFLISGSTGLLGSALAATVTGGGHHVVRLVRPCTRLAGEDESLDWDPASGTVADVGGMDFVVHLAGANIAAGRWTEERKRAIRHSRVRGTHLLSEAVAATERPPRALICASATGYYGDRAEQAVDESSGPGTGFLSQVCEEWETASSPASDAGVRVVHLRFGVVLTPAGGALAAMLLPFRIGLGGRLGSGRQFLSWVSLDDAVGAILHAAATVGLEGPVNVVTPAAVRNEDFTRVLAGVLGRPTLLPVPAPLLKLVLGEMASALLLGGSRVLPTRLRDSGFSFRDPELEPALRRMLDRPAGQVTG